MAYIKIKEKIDKAAKETDQQLYLLIDNGNIIKGGTFDTVWKKRQELDSEAVILPIPINSVEEYWQKNTQTISEKTIRGILKNTQSDTEMEHNIAPKMYHPILFDDSLLSNKSQFEIQWDTGADFTRIELKHVVHIPRKKMVEIGNVNVVGHKLTENWDTYSVYEIRISSL